jgi:hypothetical protein
MQELLSRTADAVGQSPLFSILGGDSWKRSVIGVICGGTGVNRVIAGRAGPYLWVWPRFRQEESPGSVGLDGG